MAERQRAAAPQWRWWTTRIILTGSRGHRHFGAFLPCGAVLDRSQMDESRPFLARLAMAALLLAFNFRQLTSERSFPAPLWLQATPFKCPEPNVTSSPPGKWHSPGMKFWLRDSIPATRAPGAAIRPG